MCCGKVTLLRLVQVGGTHGLGMAELFAWSLSATHSWRGHRVDVMEAHGSYIHTSLLDFGHAHTGIETRWEDVDGQTDTNAFM